MSVDVVYPLGEGILYVFDAERDGALRGAVALKDESGIVALTGIPIGTHAVLIAVVRRVYARRSRRRWCGPGRVISERRVEVPVRLGAGRPWTASVDQPGIAQAIGVEPDYPGRQGLWLDPAALARASGRWVRLELRRPREMRELPEAPIPRQRGGEQ
ncbi:hypothetical protein [Glycomyces arizonensis]|uniref:hypothetical protein n=1 Tax=Glycomyces arizonensis TaxID=256035 RepID=UPI0004210785|nr:hypothetical protein [Glycomyces arizonensis]